MFCGRNHALRADRLGVYHPVVANHGPFDLYRCAGCGSQVTFPVPAAERLAEFYARFEDGLPAHLVRAREQSPQDAWYSLLVERVVAATSSFGPERDWIELAAGTAVFTRLLARALPRSRGIAVDFHDRPASLGQVENVRWNQADLNAPEATAGLSRAAAVIAISVFEHVRDPAAFLEMMIDRVQAGGIAYLVFPDNGSAAARLLGRRWPYYSPGEHLHVPTRRGVRELARRLLAENGIDGTVAVAPIAIPYTLSYIASYLGLRAAARLIPRGLALPFPVGALELIIRVR